MRRRVVRFSLLGLSAVVAASCVMVMEEESGPAWLPSGEFRKSVAFAAGGTVAVEHTLGDITITGWEKDTVEVVAKLGQERPASPGRVRMYAAEDLEPSIDIREVGDGLKIRTKSLGGPWSTSGLDYAIQLPRSVNIDALSLEKGDISVVGVYGRMVVELGQGSLKVDNFSGPLKASIGSGRADVELLDIRTEDVIEITVSDGDITLRLQSDANVRVAADSPRGEITSDLDLGQRLPSRSLSGRLGGGQARVVLKALRGNIQILKTE